MSKKNRTLTFLFFLVAGLIYILSRHAYYVGFFNDDAFYIIGARSLLQGRYVELNQPGSPPFVNYMPGYPALLAVVAFLFKDTFLNFQLFSMALSLGSLLLLGIWLKNKTSRAIMIPTLILTAFNPL